MAVESVFEKKQHFVVGGVNQPCRFQKMSRQTSAGFHPPLPSFDLERLL